MTSRAPTTTAAAITKRYPTPSRGVCWNVGTSWTMWITARLMSNTIPVARKMAEVIACEVA